MGFPKEWLAVFETGRDVFIARNPKQLARAKRLGFKQIYRRKK